MTGPVVTWRRKPQPQTRDDQVAVQWMPPMPLDPLLYVARMADPAAQLAVATFTGESGAEGLLVVRHRRTYDYPSRIEYVTVEPGHWLAYSGGEGFLYEATDANWEQFYQRVPG